MNRTQTNEAFGLRVRREFRTAADDIFDALVNPEKQRVWMSARGVEDSGVETSVDLRVGGTWESRFRPDSETEVHDVQTYVEIDRPYRLVTDLVSESTVGGQQMPTLRGRMDMTFVPTASGTTVTVEQVGFPGAEMRDFFEAVVWPRAFDRLEAFLADR